MENNSPTLGPDLKRDKVDRSDNFHVSIAWNLIEPDPEWVSLIQSMDVDKYIHTSQVSFDVVKARVGNVVHNIELRSRKNNLGTGRGSLGLG